MLIASLVWKIDLGMMGWYKIGTMKNERERVKAMKREKSMIFSLLLLFAFMSAMAFSCNDSNEEDDDDNVDDQDDDDSENGCSEEPLYSDACEVMVEEGCSFEGFEYETPKECKDYIEGLLESNDPCEHSVAECLNQIEVTSTDCVVLQPLSCEEAEQLWNECLSLGEGEECE